MSTETLTKWTCDICGKVDYTPIIPPNSGTLPPEWQTLSSVKKGWGWVFHVCDDRDHVKLTIGELNELHGR